MPSDKISLGFLCCVKMVMNLLNGGTGLYTVIFVV